MRSLNEHKGILLEAKKNIKVEVLGSDFKVYGSDDNKHIILIVGEGGNQFEHPVYLKKSDTEEKLRKRFYVGRQMTIPNPRLNEGKLRMKGDYPVYHGTYSDTLDAISDYVVGSGYVINDDEFFTAFGDAFFKPKKGKTLRKQVEVEDKEGNLLGHLNVQIYNRGTSGNTYELNMYVD